MLLCLEVAGGMLATVISSWPRVCAGGLLPQAFQAAYLVCA